MLHVNASGYTYAQLHPLIRILHQRSRFAGLLQRTVARKYPEAHTIVQKATKDNFQPMELDQSNLLTFWELGARKSLDDLREYTARGLLTDQIKGLTDWLGGKGSYEQGKHEVRTSSKV